MSEPRSPFQGFETVIVGLSRAKLALAGFFLVLMMVHVGADIAMKLAFNAPITGTLETVSYYYMVSVVFLPLAFVEIKNEHVFVDLLFRKFPRKLQLIMYLFGVLVSVLYYGLFCYQTTLDAVKATRDKETVMANILFYVWPSRWALSLGSAALILAILLNAAKAILTGRVEEAGSDVEAAT